jgi:DNA replication protein DnaC
LGTTRRHQPAPDPRKIRGPAGIGFATGKADVAQLTPPGVARTHVAVCVGSCLRLGRPDSVYLTSVDHLVRQLREAEATGQLAKQLQT